MLKRIMTNSEANVKGDCTINIQNKIRRLKVISLGLLFLIGILILLLHFISLNSF